MERRKPIVFLPLLLGVLLSGCLESSTEKPPPPTFSRAEAKSFLENLTLSSLFEEDRVGVLGSLRESGGNVTFRIFQDRPGRGLLFSIETEGTYSFELGYARRENRTNFIVGNKTFLGRTERPWDGSAFSEIAFVERSTEASSSPHPSALGWEERVREVRVDDIREITYGGSRSIEVLAHNSTVTLRAILTSKKEPLRIESSTRVSDGWRNLTWSIVRGPLIQIQLVEDAPKTSVSVAGTPLRPTQKDEEGRWVAKGTIPPLHLEWVRLSEIEIRAVLLDGPPGPLGTPQPGTVIARMNATEGSRSVGNVTLSYTDRDGNGLLSPGDTYELRSSDPDVSLAFFDLWANMYGNKPNATPFLTPLEGVALTLLGVACARRISRE